MDRILNVHWALKVVGPDPNPTFAVIDIKNEDECTALNVPEYGQIMYNLFDSKKYKNCSRWMRLEKSLAKKY